MTTQIEGKTERLTGRIELVTPHPPLLGSIDGRGELVAAHAPCIRATWLRRPGELAEHFEQRIADDLAELAA